MSIKSSPRDGSPLLEVKNLVTVFPVNGKETQALREVSFTIHAGKTLGLVGESGSGKSVTSLSILQLIAQPGRIASGEIWFKGHNLLTYSEAQMQKIRGNEISMIFQEPMTSLNPVFTIGDQVSEVYRIHKALSKHEARDRAIEMFKLVKLPSPEKRFRDYPHQLSGGMRQRVMIAMALACEPALLIADEPTTALDVTIQAQILDLMAQLQEELGMAILLITHDLGVVSEVCEQVAVMYAGKIVESGHVTQLFAHPGHPYTRGLLDSIPRIGRKTEFLPSIEGNVPGLGKWPVGCSFQDRCKYVAPNCSDVPKPVAVDQKGPYAQIVSCYKPIRDAYQI